MRNCLSGLMHGMVQWLVRNLVKLKVGKETSNKWKRNNHNYLSVYAAHQRNGDIIQQFAK